jgi:hypothetical protein
VDPVNIRELLATQFGVFIRDEQYQEAFQQALSVFDRIDSTAKTTIDPFYFFLHQLILYLVDRISILERQLHKTENQTHYDSFLNPNTMIF